MRVSARQSLGLEMKPLIPENKHMRCHISNRTLNKSTRWLQENWWDWQVLWLKMEGNCFSDKLNLKVRFCSSSKKDFRWNGKNWSSFFFTAEDVIWCKIGISSVAAEWIYSISFDSRFSTVDSSKDVASDDLWFSEPNLIKRTYARPLPVVFRVLR